MTTTPTAHMIINLPPPRPDDTATPSDIPGTPNSGNTTMSELSTVAIKDGHRGHVQHHHQPMDAERADRISRLAGLDRVAQPRTLTPGSGNQTVHPPYGYFDSNNQPQIMRERSTVGSASATGSVGGRTTWASGSDVYDHDKMSEDQDADTSSMGGFSDEQGSLVGFGEGARTPARQQSALGSPSIGKVSAVPPHLREQLGPSPMTGVSSTSSNTTPSIGGSIGGSIGAQQHDARMLDGMTYDPDVLDTTNRVPPPAEPNMERSAETTERIMRERMGRGEGGNY